MRPSAAAGTPNGYQGPIPADRNGRYNVKTLMPTILLVEDNENNSDFLRRRLQRKGYVVLAAYDGEQGYWLAESKKPDLI